MPQHVPATLATDEPLSWSALSPCEIESVRQLVGHAIAEVECELIRKTLEHHNGNRTHAARVLGISIRSLRNKINQYTTLGLTVSEPSHHPQNQGRHLGGSLTRAV